MAVSYFCPKAASCMLSYITSDNGFFPCVRGGSWWKYQPKKSAKATRVWDRKKRKD
jgi:hypothetical protein